MRAVTEWFEHQGARFDERAGVPEAAGREVARAVAELTGAGGPVVEVGAGTGEIGRHLATVFDRYVGLDLAPAMLSAFAAKVAPDPGPRRSVALVQADADMTWPVRDATVAVVFASRVAHLLDGDHLAAEVRRLCRPKGWFLVGRVVRDRRSVRWTLRQRRQDMLRERGLVPRDAGQGGRRVLDELVARGATPLTETVAATWTSVISVEEVLGGWARVGAMGGVELAAADRAAILGDLREWARQNLGDLNRREEYEERYVLVGATLP